MRRMVGQGTLIDGWLFKISDSVMIFICYGGGMDKLTVRSCMLCEMDLKESPSVVHAHCVPFNKIVMLCNCGEVSYETDEFISGMVAFWNNSLKEQKSSILIKPNGGQFLIISECPRCNANKSGEDLQVIFIYERLSEAN